MPLENSHGKLRTTLPRSSDLRIVNAVQEPDGTRTQGGRFAPGNKVGRSKGWRTAIRRQLGADATTPLVEQLHRTTIALHGALLRELPLASCQVVTLVAARARWTTLSAHLANRATEVGLETPEGRALLDQSVKLDQRAERLAVTALDLSTRLAAAERLKPQKYAWDVAAPADEQDAAEDDHDDHDPDAGGTDATDAATGQPRAGNGATR